MRKHGTTPPDPMTPKEITVWARIAGIRRECAGRKVAVRRDDGLYMAFDPATASWTWTPDRSEARVFDFDRDHVADQLGEVEASFDARWTAEVLPPPPPPEPPTTNQTTRQGK